MAGDILAERNPAMQLLEEMNAAKWPANMPKDVAVNHDRYLAEAYVAPRGKRGRK